MTEWSHWHEKHSDKIEIVAGIDCWIWTAATGGRGYGRVSYKRTAEYAHRAAYLEACGPIPKGVVVRHMCGNRMCVRTMHLKLGSPADNARDMSEMFTTKSDMTICQVREVRRLYNEGVPIADIATQFGVAFGSVYPIVCHKSFRHVDPHLAGTHALRNPRKLSRAIAFEIRALAVSGCITQAELARQYGVAQSVISRIKCGKRWG